MLFEAKSWRNEGLADELNEKKKVKTKSVKLGMQEMGLCNRSQANGDQSLISFEDVIAKLG